MTRKIFKTEIVEYLLSDEEIIDKKFTCAKVIKIIGFETMDFYCWLAERKLIKNLAKDDVSGDLMRLTVNNSKNEKFRWINTGRIRR